MNTGLVGFQRCLEVPPLRWESYKWCPRCEVQTFHSSGKSWKLRVTSWLYSTVLGVECFLPFWHGYFLVWQIYSSYLASFCISFKENCPDCLLYCIPAKENNRPMPYEYREIIPYTPNHFQFKITMLWPNNLTWDPCDSFLSSPHGFKIKAQYVLEIFRYFY